MSAVCFLLHFTALDVLQSCSPSANNRYKVDIRQTEVASIELVALCAVT